MRTPAEANLDEWVKSRDLSKLLVMTSIGTRVSAFLQERLSKGLIKGRARHARLEDGGLGATRRGFYEVSEQLDWLVPAKAWSGDNTNSRLDLLADKFITKSPKSGFHSVELVGLAFSVPDLAIELPEVFAIEQNERDGDLTRLPDAKLEAWWAALDGSGRRAAMTEDECARHLKATFPEHFVSRDRLRELRGPQKRGPKTS